MVGRDPAGLLSGRILEIHRHPLRGDGYLFLGCPAGRPIHVMCTKDNDVHLIVLYAYQPSLPIWKNKKTRMTSPVQMMGQDYLRKCFFVMDRLTPSSWGISIFDGRGRFMSSKTCLPVCVSSAEKNTSPLKPRKNWWPNLRQTMWTAWRRCECFIMMITNLQILS